MSLPINRRKLETLFRTIKFVYRVCTVETVTRDILFIILTFVEMNIIKTGGMFIDATARILTSWDSFSLTEYFYSDSAYYLLLGLGLSMLSLALNKTREYMFEKISKKITFQMQGEYLNVISRSNLEDVEQKEFRDLLTFVPSFSYSNILDIYGEFSYSLRTLLRVVSALYILIPYIGWSALIIPLMTLPENLAGGYNRKKIKKFDDSQVENIKKVDYLQTLMTRLQYFAELRVDNSFFSLKNKYSHHARIYMVGATEKLKHFYIDTALFSVLGRVWQNSYIVFAFALAVAQKLTIGHFKAIYDYIVTIYDSSFEFFRCIFRISNYVEYGEKYFEFTDFQGFGERMHGDKKTGKATPSIEIKDLTYFYPDSGKRALNDVNLRIEPGKYVAIIGADGSGKSSIVRILCGLYQIIDGDYMIDGISIRDLDRGELKKHISVVFQDFVNYNLTVKENITLTSEKERINRSLYDTSVTVSGVKDMLENEGIKDTQVLGKYFAGGREISPGYWQRLAIARAIYRNKNVFLLDEPFLYIDEKSRGKILKNLMNMLNHEKTLIYVTQEEDFLEMFDEVYDIKKGVLVKRKQK